LNSTFQNGCPLTKSILDQLDEAERAATQEQWDTDSAQPWVVRDSLQRLIATFDQCYGMTSRCNNARLSSLSRNNIRNLIDVARAACDLELIDFGGDGLFITKRKSGELLKALARIQQEGGE
jgi:hypothetical protein